jgi:hypothetical protein
LDVCIAGGEQEAIKGLGYEVFFGVDELCHCPVPDVAFPREDEWHCQTMQAARHM